MKFEEWRLCHCGSLTVGVRSLDLHIYIRRVAQKTPPVPPDWTIRSLNVDSTPISSPAAKTRRHRPTVLHTEESLWSPHWCDADVSVGGQQTGLNTLPWPQRKICETEWAVCEYGNDPARHFLPHPHTNTGINTGITGACSSSGDTEMQITAAKLRHDPAQTHAWGLWRAIEPLGWIAVKSLVVFVVWISPFSSSSRLEIGQSLNNCGNSKKHKSTNVTRPPWQQLKKELPSET